ncbi:MAG: rhomboid family intramembrane serine protease [Nanoarchaeota archaeon]
MVFSRRIRSQPYARYSLTTVFVAINVVVYLLFLMASLLSSFFSSPSFIDTLVSFFALNPRLVIEQGSFWTLFSSMFAHISLSHLIVNMISLFFIGSFVERLIGKRRYFWLYVVSGLIASLFFVGFAYLGNVVSWGSLLFGTIDSSAVGASGALFGIAGLLAMLLPRLRVLVFFVLPMPMWGAMFLLIVGLWFFSAAAGLPIGNTAHLGGLVVGLAYGWYLRIKYARKVSLLGRMFR